MRGCVLHLHGGGFRLGLHAIAGMQHVAVTRDLALPGAVATFNEVAAFVDNSLQ